MSLKSKKANKFLKKDNDYDLTKSSIEIKNQTLISNKNLNVEN